MGSTTAFEQLLFSWLNIDNVMLSHGIGIILLLVIAAISFYVAKHQLTRFITKLVEATENKWDDLLIDHHFFPRAAMIMPYVVLLFLTPYFIAPNTVSFKLFKVIAQIGITLQVTHTISAFLNVLINFYGDLSKKRYLPIQAIFQITKLACYLVAIILVISFILDKSPLYLLSGLGAITAVIMLIFQDTIKGFVASIQIAANKMVAPGDWIEMPKYGADGDVLEIGLNTVKVQNWDKTITTIPTYALTTESFKNWRGMMSADGRRIKRSLLIDLASVHFLSDEEIAQFSTIVRIRDYMATKIKEIDNYNRKLALTASDTVYGRRLTNLGTFRAYIEHYLADHPMVNQQMTHMVRQLPANSTGLPLELYFFCKDKTWVNYERIQADIFDHLIAVAPHFNLRLFQHPTGYDLQQAKGFANIGASTAINVDE